jgi:hypothetical protein
MQRQAQQLTRGLAAQLSGRRERGADRKVRRNSYDVDDRRAQVFRPIGDGSAEDALGVIDSLVRVVSDWDDEERRTGGTRPLGLHGIRVLETLLGRRGTIGIDFRSGRIEPAIDTIARVARLSRTTVIRALAKLKALKILDWVRRTQKTDRGGLFAPQREQVSNAYFLTPEGLPKRVAQRLRDLIAKRRRQRANRTTTVTEAKAPAPQPMNAEMVDALARLGAGIAARDAGQSASPPYGQYQSSGVKG